jgi:hypothetical protein
LQDYSNVERNIKYLQEMNFKLSVARAIAKSLRAKELSSGLNSPAMLSLLGTHVRFNGKRDEIVNNLFEVVYSGCMPPYPYIA